MIDVEHAAHNLALLKLQEEHIDSLSNAILYARYAELYNEFLEIGKKYSREHSRGTRIGEF